MESLNNIIEKRFNKSLVAFLKLIDPEKKYKIDELLAKTWDRLTLTEQRKLYLYLLYRKWRGLDIYGEPFFIIKNCHPVPFNWNGCSMINTLMKSSTRMVRARFNGSYGIYTLDEARVWDMTEIEPRNYKPSCISSTKPQQASLSLTKPDDN